MRLKNSLFALLFIAVLAGCKDSSTEPTPSSGDIMPLKVGNKWNYKTYVVEPNTGMKVDSKQDFTMSVASENTINGEKWFTVDKFLGSAESPQLQNNSEGLWALDEGAKGLFFKYPATANTTYSNPGGTMTVVSTSVKVDAGGKSYTCYQYTFNNVEEAPNFYVAPGVGLIKMSITTTEQGQTYTVSQELQSYSLK